MELISLSGIPASFLGYADSIELREALVHSNVAFATEIIDQQEADTAALNDIMDAIASLMQLGVKPSKYVSIMLIPPVVLILQLIEMTLSSVGNITNIFTSIGIKVDPFYLLEQYVPQLDWDEFKKVVDMKKLEDGTKNNMAPQQAPDAGF